MVSPVQFIVALLASKFITNGSNCTELNELYVFQIDSNAIVPDFIRMDVDAVGYEVLENPDVPGVWFNNTVCQDNLPAPTTASSEFFACFVNDGLNRQFNSYEWNWTPTNAGVIISNDFQETTVGIVETGVGSTVGVVYAVIITANSITKT